MGMKVTIFGSGSFVSSLERFGPSYLLEVDEKKILVDAGCGCQIRLLEKGISLEELDYIFITHFHPDHTTDLVSIIVRYKMLTRNKPELEDKLIIFGPQGIKEFYAKLFRAYDLPQFIDLPGPKVKVLNHEMSVGRLRIIPYTTEHLGVSAQSYRFEYDDKAVVFSGDTTKSVGIVKASARADLLVIDSSLNKDEDPIPHVNTRQIAEIAVEADAKKVVLSHILGYNEKKDLVAEVKEAYSGEVILAKDLMEIVV